MECAIAERRHVAVVIPWHRVTRHVLGEIGRVDPEVHSVYCGDDACPDGSADLVKSQRAHEGGVGAFITGYREAVADRADAKIKLDGNGQMVPSAAERLIAPILHGEADSTRCNDFCDLTGVLHMSRAHVPRTGHLCGRGGRARVAWRLRRPCGDHHGLRLPLAGSGHGRYRRAGGGLGSAGH